jgi:hypothetical protein
MRKPRLVAKPLLRQPLLRQPLLRQVVESPAMPIIPIMIATGPAAISAADACTASIDQPIDLAV